MLGDPLTSCNLHPIADLGTASRPRMTEIEAKFVVRRPEQIEDAMRTLAERGSTIIERGVTDHVDRYFDTAEWSILAAGWACRTRQRDGRTTVTMKSLHGGASNVFMRDEINQPLEEPGTLPSPAMPEGPVQERLQAMIDGRPLAELFRSSCRRTIYDIEIADATTVSLEMDIDRTRIEAGKATEKATGTLEFTELELELRSGSPEDLERIAALLQDEAGLMPAHFSKFERGLQAAGLEMDSLLGSPGTPGIGPEDSILTLLYDYLAEQFEIVQRQHPRALEGIDPEGVHQMRVSTRRLRAVMKAFRSILGDEAVTRFNAELRWLARNLGRARDADVTERGARDASDSEADHYENFLEQETISAYEHLVDILQSERCAALETELHAFITAGPTPQMREQFGRLSIAASAQQFVRAALGKLLAHGDAIDADAPPRELHKLRIEAKRFRYLLDFFGTIQAEEWLPLTEAVKKLQDVLGEHQDAVTAQARLAEYAASLSREHDREKLVTVAGRMQGEIDRIASCRRDFAVTWAEFRNLAA
jgi:triphosphatase